MADNKIIDLERLKDYSVKLKEHFTAGDITVKDVDKRYDSEDVEAALKEISDRTGYIVPDSVQIDATFTANVDSEGDYADYDIPGSSMSFIEGETYIVTINGVEKSSIATAFSNMGGLWLTADNSPAYDHDYTIGDSGYFNWEGLDTFTNPVILKIVGPRATRMPRVLNSIQNITDGEDTGSIAQAGCEASGPTNCTALGFHTKATGDVSTALGVLTVASGDYSTATGRMTIASNYCTFTEGEETEASGIGAHAEGAYTKAKGDYTHAQGIYTIASGYAQHVQGVGNVEDTANLFLDIIGGAHTKIDANHNLVLDGPRKNIEATTWTGNKKLKGDVYVHAKDDSSGGIRLSTPDVLAAYFDASAAYTAGSYVTNKDDGCLYKAKADITAGAWDASKWDKITVAQAIATGSAASDEVSEINLDGRALDVIDEGEFYAGHTTVEDALQALPGITCEAFDKAKVYNVGDFVIKDGALYKANAAHAAGEVFIPTKWDKTTIVENLGAGEYATKEDVDNAFDDIFGL